MNELLQMNATIRSVGENRTWHVKFNFNERKRNFVMTTGWKSFSQEHNLQIGDVCKFEMTQREPLSFTITINQATKEPIPDQFQENQLVHEKPETTPVKDMEYVGNFEEGILRSCTKTHGLKSIDLNLNYFSSLYSVHVIKYTFTNHVFFVVNYCRF
ncbi:unnamed protein product [Trifolium pratense]|uniref:Uncharacterized protein n=1 Tax=Trifolium pratense TaxID=57577 RepID=A0ACB0K6E6_TRIPR|nr:unnamed protein product [Trifolium pratense]